MKNLNAFWTFAGDLVFGENAPMVRISFLNEATKLPNEQKVALVHSVLHDIECETIKDTAAPEGMIEDYT